MGRIARSLTALALTSIALVGPSARASDDPPVAPPPPIEPYPLDTPEAPVVTTLADQIRAFRASKFQEIDQAVFELRQLIAERSQQLARLESELRDAQQELGVLEALAELQAADTVELEAGSSAFEPDRPCHLHTPTPIEVPPGTLDAVVPASAEVEPQWQGVVRIASANGGRLDLLHESADGSGKVQAGALQADVIEIRVRSEQEARIIAQALKADDNAVVSWPDLRILAAPEADPRRIDAIEATMRRLAETVDRIDRRTSSTGDHPSGDPIVVSPPAEIPPAPSIPD
ncbi:hypothetical protein AB1L88_23190 [Tautonia sp. JC769]|uniref:hypothetical protein n=1 Tax=Tautonia sp. JC769 TaxID=3232135 RepID=UPI00345A9D5B